MKTQIPFVVGLDIGVSSIGWAAVIRPEFARQYAQILGAGVRIVPLTVDENTNFPKGKAITTTKDRTMKRTARRNLHRYRLRRHKLMKKLKEVGMLPNEELFGLSALALYGLRDKALKEQLSLEEIGRILLHLNQKRGYKSSRKAQNEDEEGTNETTDKPTKQNKDKTAEKDKPTEKGYLEKIADREKALAESGQTIGQHFYQEFLKNPLFQTKNEIYNRDTYKAEFNKIWKFQAQFYPKLLTEKLRKEIGEEIIYYQRRLKSQKHLVSWCSYEPTKEIVGKSGKKITTGYKTAPRSSPLFQEFVVWQQVNNLKILTHSNKKGQELSLAEKEYLFAQLNRNTKPKISAKECLLLLAKFDSKYADKNVGYSLNFENIECNRTYAELYKILGENPDYQHYLQFEHIYVDAVNDITGEVYELITKDFEQQPMYKLWHLLYATEEDKHLKERLDDNNGFFRFDAATVLALCKIDFVKAGFGNLSAKAIRKLLPQMAKGLAVRDACEMVGYKYSDSETLTERENRPLKDKLDVLPKNSLKNPVVEKILNQAIQLVNEIMEEYGRPTEIRIELARELRMNAKKRQDMTKKIGEKSREKLKLEADLRDLIDKGKIKRKEGRDRISLGDLLKYELWKQQDGNSPYTGKNIPLAQLFDTQFYDKDHIFPQSRFYDDSPTNLVLVEKAENLAKGNKYLSAADYIKQVKGEAEFEAFMNRINDCKGFSRTKKARLLATELPDDFITRQLADTRYVGKKLKEILRDVCSNVTSTTGSVTAYLREQWELDAVMLKNEEGKVQLDKNKFAIKLKESLLKEMRFEQYPHLKQRDEELQKLIETGKATDKDREKYRAEQRKNRDDHRHHLLDAVVIAFTTTRHIQYLNNLNAAYQNPKEAQQAKDEKIFAAPMPDFREVVKGVLAGTLVSFRGTRKIGSWRTNPATGKRELTPRGYLHKETLYGSVKRYEVLKIGKKLFEQIDQIVDTELKTQLQTLLKQYGGEWGALEKYLKKKPLLKNGKPVEEITVFSRQVTAKYALDSIVAKDTQYIVDEGIRRKVEERLQVHAQIDQQIETLKAKKPKTLEDEAAIRELQAQKLQPLWLNEAKGIEIKTVKLFTKNDNSVTPLYDKPNTPYVQQRNNHHVALYKDRKGKIQECVVTFWEAVTRKRLGLPVVIENPKAVWQQITEQQITDRFIVGKEANMPEKDWEFVQAIVGDEMFVLDLDKETLQKAIAENDYVLISKHLYRVQKFSSGEYVFRHHLEANIDNEKAAITLTKSSFERGIKVKISRLGKISIA